VSSVVLSVGSHRTSNDVERAKAKANDGLQH